MIHQRFTRDGVQTPEGWHDDRALKRLMLGAASGLCSWWFAHDMADLYHELNENRAPFTVMLTPALSAKLNHLVDSHQHITYADTSTPEHKRGDLAFEGMRMYLQGLDIRLNYRATLQGRRQLVVKATNPMMPDATLDLPGLNGWIDPSPPAIVVAAPKRSLEGSLINLRV